MNKIWLNVEPRQPIIYQEETTDIKA